MWRPLLGFHPLMYPLFDAFNLLMGLVQHTELIGKLGWLERPFATPSHHRYRLCRVRLKKEILEVTLYKRKNLLYLSSKKR